MVKKFFRRDAFEQCVLCHPTPQRNLTNSKEKSKILITMQKHAYYRFFQKEIIIKIRRSEDGPK